MATAAPIKVSFAAVGTKQLSKAFDNVERRVRNLNKQSEKLAHSSKLVGSGAAKAAALEDKIAAKSASARIREEKRVEREKIRSANVASREAKKAATARIREEKMAANAAIREEKRVAREAAKQQHSVMQQRRRMSGKITGVLGRGVGGGLRAIGSVAGNIGMLGAAGAVGASINENIKHHQLASQLEVATRVGGESTLKAADIVAQSQGLGSKYGVSSTEITAGLSKVAQKAGGAAGVEKIKNDWEGLVKTAAAFGISMDEMGSVTAAALNAGVKPGEELQQLMLDLVAMGKKGSVEFADLASELPKLVGSGKGTAGVGPEMIKSMVGLAQIAVQTTDSPEEARTAVNRAVADIGQHASKFEAAGLEVRDPTTQMLKDPAQLIPEIINTAFTQGLGKGKNKLMGPAALNKVFGVKGRQLMTPLIRDYVEGGGGEAGKAAVAKKISGAIATTGGDKITTTEREQSLGIMLQSPATQMKQSFENLHREIAKLIPDIIKLMPTIQKVIVGFGRLATWMTKNPIKGVGAIVAANVGKEIAAAGLGGVLKTGIESGLSGGLKGLGGLGAVTIAATTVYLAGEKVIDEVTEAAVKTGKDKFAAGIEAENLMRVIKAQGGTATEEQKQKLAMLKGTMVRDVGALEGTAESIFGQGKISQAAGIASKIGNFGGGSLADVYYKGTEQQQGVNRKDEVETLAQINHILETGKLFGPAAKALNEAAANLNKASLANPNAAPRQGTPSNRAGVK